MSSLLRSMQKNIFKAKGLRRDRKTGNIVSSDGETDYGKHWPRGKTADTKFLNHD